MSDCLALSNIRLVVVKAVVASALFFLQVGPGAASTAYVTSCGPFLRLIDVERGEAVGDLLPVGEVSRAVAVSPTRNEIYVGSAFVNGLFFGPGAVQYLTPTGAVTGTTPVGEGLWVLAASLDGTRLFAGHRGGVTEIDTATRTITAMVSIGANTDLAVTGTRLYVGRLGSVEEFDLATRQSIRTYVGGGSLRGIAVDATRGRLYVSQNSSPTEGEFVLFDVANGNILAVAPAGPWVQAVVAFGDRAVYVADGEGVQVRHPASLALLSYVLTGAGARGMALSPDGRRLVVTNIAARTVSIIDTGTNRLVTNVPTGSGSCAWGAFVGPASLVQEPIPTMRETALVALAALIGLAGIAAMSRKRAVRR